VFPAGADTAGTDFGVTVFDAPSAFAVGSKRLARKTYALMASRL
jgi:hypothetical protein